MFHNVAGKQEGKDLFCDIKGHLNFFNWQLSLELHVPPAPCTRITAAEACALCNLLLFSTLQAKQYYRRASIDQRRGVSLTEGKTKGGTNTMVTQGTLPVADLNSRHPYPP
ncbi:hypothetical protein AAFF_G00033830 [Aldrovandia affinis]|uniref:Uncharacterized protein n=1 Tax=Aldrovandia affinis TaxID=143900 RepID=A0AAD7WFZ6_9TELE|nr:hypothetical protein AAFF_G00033830 [Aldrovandia affinis]